MENQNFVYETTLNVDGETFYYIGKHNNSDPDYIGSGQNLTIALRLLANSKYGDKVKIKHRRLVEYLDRTEVCGVEKRIIKIYAKQHGARCINKQYHISEHHYFFQQLVMCLSTAEINGETIYHDPTPCKVNEDDIMHIQSARLSNHIEGLLETRDKLQLNIEKLDKVIATKTQRVEEIKEKQIKLSKEVKVLETKTDDEVANIVTELCEVIREHKWGKELSASCNEALRGYTAIQRREIRDKIEHETGYHLPAAMPVVGGVISCLEDTSNLPKKNSKHSFKRRSTPEEDRPKASVEPFEPVNGSLLHAVGAVSW